MRRRPTILRRGCAGRVWKVEKVETEMLATLCLEEAGRGCAAGISVVRTGV